MHSKLEVSVIQAKKWSYRVPYVDLIPSHQGEYLEAIECYTKCLRECEKAVIYTNRALCYLKLSKVHVFYDNMCVYTVVITYACEHRYKYNIAL